MTDAVSAGRWQFAFTVMFHYLFPILTMGLGTLIAVLKTIELRKGDARYGVAARFWAKIFAINFAMGVVTGIPMEFQFGTNWATFSHFSGGVVGQTLFMEGVFAFFAESSFLGMFLLGEKRLSKRMHWLSSVMVAGGALVSGYFIVITDAWMQNPVKGSYVIQTVNGQQRANLVSLGKLLTNPYGLWQYLHAINGALTTGAMVMAGIGAYYLLVKKHEEFGRLSVKVGVIAGALFAILQLFPTGNRNALNVSHYQPVKTAAMEGLFETQAGAPLAIIGMPDTVNGKLLDPIYIPKGLSFLIYGNPNAKVQGLNDTPKTDHPPVELVYYAYHIMIGLGTIFIAVLMLGVLLFLTKRLFTTRLYLWILMLAMPFPYIANQAGWVVAEVGRQPWVVYGLMRTSEGVSANVSGGETVFTLLGFMGLYALLGLLYLFMFVRIVAQGPQAMDATGNVIPTPSAGGAAVEAGR
ncbi:MAG TPA: cytochrome ubiquinol oxidase subunit I [Armatimonadota bacterium]|jgi:cytochrome d ubiquinol oxidase subunit I